MDFADVQAQYAKNKDLKKQDVEALVQWINKQPHLPKINELQGILFLHSCYCNSEPAKTTIDNFFTFRTMCPDFFHDKTIDLVSTQIDICFLSILPKRTPEGHVVLLVKMIDSNADKFNFSLCVQYFDMVSLAHFYQEGIFNGHSLAIDFNGLTFGHLAKIGVMNLKKFLYYLQEALPVRIKGVHFFNISPLVDKLMVLIRPFIRKDVLEVLHFHETVDDLAKFIPLECLPKDYGGSGESMAVLHEKNRKKLEDSVDFFKWEETFVVDESKRTEKRKIDDILGTDGTFKKLDID